ncbi:unnamed protein product [Lathyrus oleraceus]
MSNTTKVLDPTFHGVGQRLGTEIWRIENFQPVSLPKSEYGKFYMRDSYVVLQTSQGKKLVKNFVLLCHFGKKGKNGTFSRFSSPSTLQGCKRDEH